MNIIHYITACCVLGMICPNVNPPIALDSLELGTSLNSSQRHRPGYCERLCAWLRGERNARNNPDVDDMDRVGICTALICFFPHPSNIVDFITVPTLYEHGVYAIPGLISEDPTAMNELGRLLNTLHDAAQNMRYSFVAPGQPPLFSIKVTWAAQRGLRKIGHSSGDIYRYIRPTEMYLTSAHSESFSLYRAGRDPFTAQFHHDYLSNPEIYQIIRNAHKVLFNTKDQVLSTPDWNVSSSTFLSEIIDLQQSMPGINLCLIPLLFRI